MRTMIGVWVAVGLWAMPAMAQPDADAKGCADHPLVTRMANMRIQSCKQSDFEQYMFRTSGNIGNKALEGRFMMVRYTIKPNNQAPSALAIHRNFQAALKGIGAKEIWSSPRYTTFQILKDGKEVWVEVDTAWGAGYMLNIVEKAAMVQEVTANAELFKSGLAATGHVEIPGIFFDTGKSVLKPESAAAVAEVAKLLQAEPALKVFVVGHTDNVAALALNMTLSQARAEAVVQALVSQHGIAAARLIGRGAGPLAPVASNDAEDGRAKNRRVELVKQ